MGSFNTTCAISHAPIREGDKVRLFFLVSESYRHVTEEAEQFSISKGCQCYPHDDFKVIGGMALEATYADYNNYDFDNDSIPAKYILNKIRKNYSENIPEEGIDYNPYHDHMNVLVDDLDWETVMDMIHSGRLFLKGYTDRKSFVATMAVHESVFQALLPERIERYDFNIKDYSSKTIDEAVAEIIASFSPEILDNIKQQRMERHTRIFATQLAEAENDPEKLAKIHEALNVYANEDAFEIFTRDENNLPGGSRDYVWGGGKIPQLMVNFANKLTTDDETCYTVTTEDIANIAKLSVETEYFNFSMVVYNFMYRPIMTSGQDHDLKDHAVMMRKVADAVSDIKSPWSEESLPVDLHREQWQEIDMSSVEKCFNECYGVTAPKYIATLKDAIKDLDVLIIKPEEMTYKNDKYELYDMIDNKTLELRIYNK